MTDYFYGRVSSKDQKDSQASPKMQRDRALAAGIKPEHTYIDEARSGGLKDDDTIKWTYQEGEFITTINLNPRPKFKELLDKVQRGDSITFIKHDRIARHLAFQDLFHSYCKSRGVELRCLDQSNDRLTRRVLGVIGEEEILSDADRNQSIQESYYKRGEWPFRAPFGMLKNSRDDGVLRYPDKPEGCLFPDPAKVSIILRAFSRMAAGDNSTDICHDLNISSGQLHDIVRNKAYLGMTHFGEDDWKLTDLIPALVTPEIFKAANANIKFKPKRGERDK
jgi:DNA invertase Pin-like site-specific DNA recombinase